MTGVCGMASSSSSLANGFCVVSLNPAIDAEWRVDDVVWEEKNSVLLQRRWPGGKGVNVARWLKLLRAPSELLIPLGGASGREMAGGIRGQGVHAHVVRLRDETRVNVVVTTASGRQMRFNPAGPKIYRDEWREVIHIARRELVRGCSLILSGALPRGIPAHAYAKLIRLAHERGRIAFLDCDGAALATGVRAKPFLVKPNVHELSSWAGARLSNRKRVREAAAALSRATGGWVLVSLGAEGALLVNVRERVALAANAPRVAVVNTVGAGDALLAAVAASVMRGAEPEEWLRAGVAAGTAAALCEAGRLPPVAAVRNLARRISVRRVKLILDSPRARDGV